MPHGFTKSSLALVFLTGLLFGCESASQSESQTSSAIAVDFAAVEHGNYSAINTLRTVTIKDTSAWAALWNEHKASTEPVPPLPAINLSQDMILGVFLGNFPNGCYSVDITSIRQIDGQKLRVSYRGNTPAANDICTQSFVQPFHLVSIPHSDLPVEFAAE